MIGIFIIGFAMGCLIGGPAFGAVAVLRERKRVANSVETKLRNWNMYSDSD